MSIQIATKSKRLEMPTVAKPIRRRISLRSPAGKLSKAWINVEHTEDPKQALLEKIGTIPDGVVQFSNILLAIYQPPIVRKTGGGIILTDQMSDDDIEEFTWQGKVSLIVAMGSLAYQDDETTKFNGIKNKVGDWVWCRPSDGMLCEVNNVMCRVVTERHIIGTLPHPDVAW